MEDELNEIKKDMERPKTTRKPGRPPHVRPQQPKIKKGVVADPSDESHYMEFLHDKPLVFKKLFAFFKEMAVSKVHIAFMKNNITIYSSDHHGKNHIRVNINCNNIDHYYVKKDLDVGILCKNLELIMKTIDKNYSSICLISQTTHIQKEIRIIFKNKLEIEENHKIELIGQYNKNDNDQRFVDDDYKIKFKLDCKYFKKMITDIKSFSEQVTIRKDGPEDNLIFEYSTSNKKIKSSYIIKNEKKINLQDNTGEEPFRTSFVVGYVKPISSALLSDTIEIYADENKPLKFIIQMDESIDVVILTDIIDNRDPKLV
jgi:hypothetical protein